MRHTIRDQSYQLFPYPTGEYPANAPVRIRGVVQHYGTWLNVHFNLSGEIQRIKQPQSDNVPPRRDNLWRHTCFELFVTTADNNQYWEYNINLPGHWNVYRFSGYRENQQPETRIDQITGDLIRHDSNLLEFAVKAPLPVDLENHALLIGISCVIEDNEENLYYYALSHPSDKPDFHHRRGFSLTVTL